jgi:uncharacterized coiled-coil protein SlyX
MSVLTEILDRLSGMAALREKLQMQDKVLEGMQRIMLDQQKEIAELRGTLKAMLELQKQKHA